MRALEKSSVSFAIDCLCIVLGAVAFVTTTLLVLCGPDFLLPACATLAGLG